MARRAVIAGFVFLVPVACGGRVIGDPTPDPTSDAAVAATRSSGGSSAYFDGTLALPDCVKGSPKTSPPDDACVFVVDGRCYPTKVKACACACPRKAGTSCINGFPDDDGTTLVTCH